MAKYIGKRIVYMAITLMVIITLTFILMKLLPGTPFDAERFSMMPPNQQAALLAQYGLDQPVVVQYFKYLGNIVTGNFGTSFFYSGQPVLGIVARRIGPSALIGGQAVLLGLGIGLSLGVVAAWKHNSGIDYFTMVLAVLGVSVPNFVAAALLQYFVGLKWGILPVAFWESWKYSILPSIALCFSPLAQVARFTRTQMLAVLSQDYMVTARAKGLGQAQMLIRHAVRNSIIPVVTVMGPIVVSLLTGSLAVESIFSIPGIGSLFVDSIKTNDYSVIMGVTIFYSLFYIVVILIVDVLYSVIDPRIRLAAEKGGE